METSDNENQPEVLNLIEKYLTSHKHWWVANLVYDTWPKQKINENRNLKNKNQLMQVQKP